IRLLRRLRPRWVFLADPYTNRGRQRLVQALLSRWPIFFRMPQTKRY
ncbi:hypothetical protein CSUI_007590, partial [Cystoisospora suis]